MRGGGDEIKKVRIILRVRGAKEVLGGEEDTSSNQPPLWEQV